MKNIYIMILLSVISISLAVWAYDKHSEDMVIADANIMALGVLRTVGDIYHDTNGTYVDVCNEQNFITVKKGVARFSPDKVVCNDSESAWATSAKLNDRSRGYLCVDSTGARIQIPTSINTATSCIH